MVKFYVSMDGFFIFRDKVFINFNYVHTKLNKTLIVKQVQYFFVKTL